MKSALSRNVTKNSDVNQVQNKYAAVTRNASKQTFQLNLPGLFYDCVCLSGALVGPWDHKKGWWSFVPAHLRDIHPPLHPSVLWLMALYSLSELRFYFSWSHRADSRTLFTSLQCSLILWDHLWFGFMSLSGLRIRLLWIWICACTVNVFVSITVSEYNKTTVPPFSPS